MPETITDKTAVVAEKTATNAEKPTLTDKPEKIAEKTKTIADKAVNDHTDLGSLSATVKKKVKGLLGVYFLMIVGTILLFLIVTTTVILIGLLIADGGYIYPRLLILGIIVILAAGYCVVIVLRPLFKMFAPRKARGKKISRKDHPELFALIDEIVEKVDCLKPKQVRISNECNAYVFYPSLFGYIFSGRQNLTIGIPLLYGLNKTELKSILSHEFGHFTQKSVSTNRIANLSEFICASIARSTGDIDRDQDSSVKQAARGFAEFVGKIMAKQYYKIASDNAILSRAQEFNADHYSQKVAGSEAAVSALCKIEDLSPRWAHFTSIIAEYEKQSKRAPENVFEAFKTYCSHVDKLSRRESGRPAIHLSEVDAGFSSRITQEDNLDTHPSTPERINAIRSYQEVTTVWDDSPAFEYFSEKEVDKTFEYTTKEIRWQLYPKEEVSIKKDLTPTEIDSEMEDVSPYYLDKFCVYKLFYYSETQVDPSEEHPEYMEDPFTKENARVLEEFYYAEDDMATLNRIADEGDEKLHYRYAGKLYDGKNVPLNEHESYFEPLKEKAYEIARHCNWWLCWKESSLGKADVLKKFTVATPVQLKLAALSDDMVSVNKIWLYYNSQNSSEKNAQFYLSLVSQRAQPFVSSVEDSFRNIVAPLMAAEGEGRILYDELAEIVGKDSQHSTSFKDYMSRTKTDLQTFLIAYSTAGEVTLGIQNKFWEEIKKDIIRSEGETN